MFLTGWNRLDPIIAIIVAINIVWTGAKLLRRSVMGLLDAALPPEEDQAIRQVLGRYARDGIHYHALRTRQAGRRSFISLDVLVPGERYARMNNVWFIPSTTELKNWLKKVGFRDAQVANVAATTTEEQRSTDWMTFQSLAHCLDPGDASRTVEGYPAPRRAVIVANAP